MNLKRGFTLIELLIVMAILGVLAVVVLVAINPVQQLARTRDAGRKSTIAQMGHALEAYYITQNAEYPDETADWAQELIDAGELSILPSKISNSLGTDCTSNESNLWCYDETNQTVAVMYSNLESNSEVEAKCDGSDAWFVWSTTDGRAGLVCGGQPIPGTQTFID